MAPQLALGYIREFQRCARKGAVIVFQVPQQRHINVSSAKRLLRDLLYSVLPSSVVVNYRRRKYKNVPSSVIDRLPKIPMEMNCLPRKRIAAALKSCRLLDICDTSSKDDAFTSWTYYFRKIGD